MNILSLFDGISAGQLAANKAGIKVDKYYASEIDKNAIKVTMKNYPDTIQIGDVTKVKAEDLPKIDLLIGGSPCFVKDTKIITQNEIKNIEDVSIGDYVITHNNRFKKVLKIGNTISETIIIKAQGIKPTETTKEHPYYVRKMNRVWDNKNRTSKRVFSEPEWIEAFNLKKGDFIGVPINKLEINELDLTEEECYILGRYLADGHTRKDFRISEDRPHNRYWQLILSIGNNKLEEFKKNISENNYSCYAHTASVHRVVFSNKRLVEISERYCGIGAKNKNIHKTLLDLPIYLLKKLIDGYLSGDGSHKDGVYRATSISEDLIMSLSQAVAKVYRVNSTYEHTIRSNKTIIENRLVNQNDTYTITFRKEIRPQSKAIIIDDIIWTPFKNIIETKTKKIVYNLEVQDDNSYTANHVIVHNCQGFSFAGKQLNFEDERSKLFFEYVRLLKECNPKYFLLENVKMKKEYQDIISSYLGVEPIEINSNLVSAQDRKRLYWTNISNISCIDDKNIKLKDILEYPIEFSELKNWTQGYYNGKKRIEILRTIEDNKAFTLTTNSTHNKHYYLNKDKNKMHHLTSIERERLQTFPDDYTLGVSKTERHKQLGNSWTVDVITHIFKGIK